MISSWVPEKNIDLEIIDIKIKECIKSKHLTNNGKNVIELQKHIKKIFEINNEKEVLLTCNGAMGINALIGGLNIFHNKKLKWAVQSFTFPCSNQGLLNDSIIVDLDENMGPDVIKLDSLKNVFDGILVTNCFGASTNIDLYEKFCKENNKILLFDNAASSYTFYKNCNHLNYGNGCMVSLHHTKPIGFGEGGFIVFDKKYLETMEKSICFGFTKTDKYNYDIYSSNYKMSEIASIYIYDYLRNFRKIYEHHKKITMYFIKQIKQNNLHKKFMLFKNFSSYTVSLMSTLPLVFYKNTDINFFIENNIEAKKYYYPLNLDNNYSHNLFNCIICLPLNIDTTFKIIDYYIDILNKLPS